MGKGYVGWSRSVNAEIAYANGEMPISKWTKEEIIAAVGEFDEAKADLLSAVNVDTLREKVLKKTSWHHTSAMFNKTDFYSVDKDAVINATPDEIEEWALEPKKSTATGDIFKGDFHYLTWSGGVYSKHKQATEHDLENVTIEKRGRYYYVYDDAGEQIVRKQIGSTGTKARRAEYSYWE